MQAMPSRIRKDVSGSVALFSRAPGPTQNPLPRRTVSLARRYGKEIACLLKRCSSASMRPTTFPFVAAQVSVTVEPATIKEELELMAKDTSAAYKSSAAVCFNKSAKGSSAMILSLPVRVWKSGEQPLFALGGEVVIHYAIEIKEHVGSGDAFVLGYSNDVMEATYIPTANIKSQMMKRGMPFYGLPIITLLAMKVGYAVGLWITGYAFLI